MDLNVENVLNKMLQAGTAEFGENWGNVSTFATVEFKKIAETVVDIAKNVAQYELDPEKGYPAEVGKMLLEMQKKSTEAVLVGLTALTLLAVERAINAVLQVIKEVFGGILDTIF